ncbi:MAG: hypothetical protein ABI763_10300 [Bacteroidota bacterium]
MEIHQNTNKQLNDLLTEARHENPVMNVKEVEKIIAEGKYTPAGGSRGFHIGMNNMIVLCGIVVSSFLAYMALKVDNGDMASNVVPVKTEMQSSSVTHPVLSNVQPANDAQVIPAPAPAVENNHQVVIDANKIRPKQDISTLLASNKNLVATPTKTEEHIIEPVAAKMPSGEYVITFNSAGQDIKMRLVGDEISEFSVDGNVVPADQYGDFEDILSEGKNYLIGNTHADEGASSLNLIKYFDGQLRSDKILDKEIQYKFELSSAQLIVNGDIQTAEIFKKYKGLYEAKTGKTITEGSVYKFERGAKSE